MYGRFVKGLGSQACSGSGAPVSLSQPPADCLLFVYGSLKRDQANHRELCAARFVAEVRTAPRFALRMIAGYPALVPGERAIFGELFRVPGEALPALDEFEGDEYARHEIELEGDLRALAYLACSPDEGSVHLADEWPGPDGSP